MRFKYYLRGAGVGIIVTTLIFTIALVRYKPSLSADEIRQQAQKLGMVMPSDTASGDAERKTDAEGSTGQEKPVSQEKETPENDTPKNETKAKEDPATKTSEESSVIKFEVKGGQFSDVVSENLASKGLVPDAEEYNKWLMKHHYDSDIQPGVYYINSDATFKEIAEIITTKQE